LVWSIPHWTLVADGRPRAVQAHETLLAHCDGPSVALDTLWAAHKQGRAGTDTMLALSQRVRERVHNVVSDTPFAAWHAALGISTPLLDTHIWWRLEGSSSTDAAYEAEFHRVELEVRVTGWTSEWCRISLLNAQAFAEFVVVNNALQGSPTLFTLPALETLPTWLELMAEE